MICGRTLHWNTVNETYKCPLKSHTTQYMANGAIVLNHRCNREMPERAMSDPKQTPELGKNFVRSQRHVDDLYDQLQRAKDIRDKDMKLLGERLAPDNMGDGEKIGCWCNTGHKEERCFVVQLVRGKYHVSERGAREVTR